MGQQEKRTPRQEGKGRKGRKDIRFLPSFQQLPARDRLFLGDAFEHVNDYRELSEELREGDRSHQGLGMLFDPEYRQAIDTWTHHALNQRLTTSEADNDLRGMSQRMSGIQHDQWMLDRIREVTPGAASDIDLGSILADIIAAEDMPTTRRGSAEGVSAISPERQLSTILLGLNEQALNIATSAGKESLGDLNDDQFGQVTTAVHSALHAAEASGSRDVRDALLNIALFSREPVKASEYYKADDVNSVMENVRAMLALYGDRYIRTIEEHMHDATPLPVDPSRFGKEFVGLPMMLLGMRLAEGSTVMLPTNFSTMVQRGLVPGISNDMRAFLIEQQTENFLALYGTERFLKFIDAQGGHPYSELGASYATPNAVANLFLLDANLYQYGDMTEQQLHRELGALGFADMATNLRERVTAARTLHLIEQIDDVSVYAFASAAPAKGKGEAVIDLLIKKGDVVGMLSVVSNGKSSGLPVELPEVPMGFFLHSLQILHEQLSQPVSSPRREQLLAQTGDRRRTAPIAPSERQKAATATNVTIDIGRLYDRKAGLNPSQRQQIAGQLEDKISSSRVKTRMAGKGDKARQEWYIEIKGFEVILQPINTTSYKAVSVREFTTPEEQ